MAIKNFGFDDDFYDDNFEQQFETQEQVSPVVSQEQAQRAAQIANAYPNLPPSVVAAAAQIGLGFGHVRSIETLASTCPQHANSSSKCAIHPSNFLNG